MIYKIYEVHKDYYMKYKIYEVHKDYYGDAKFIINY